MRTIQFRGRKKGNKEWAYGLYSKEYSTGSLRDAIIQVCHITERKKTIFIDDGTLGQYTGIKDTNYKPIYEGDIVEIDYFMLEGVTYTANLAAEVFYDDARCSFSLENIECDGFIKYKDREVDKEVEIPMFEIQPLEDSRWTVVSNVYKE